jgi:hypothetical protein
LRPGVGKYLFDGEGRKKEQGIGGKEEKRGKDK